MYLSHCITGLLVVLLRFRTLPLRALRNRLNLLPAHLQVSHAYICDVVNVCRLLETLHAATVTALRLQLVEFVTIWDFLS